MKRMKRPDPMDYWMKTQITPLAPGGRPLNRHKCCRVPGNSP